MNIELELETDKWTEFGINFSTLISIIGNFSQLICNWYFFDFTKVSMSNLKYINVKVK